VNFDNEKYEYLLHTWGGFYNDEHKAKHGLEPGYFWFDTAEERKRFLDELREVEKKYNARCLASSFEEGKHVRYRTIARMKLIYKGKKYLYEDDFGFGYPVDAAEFQWTENNYSCDCNRSLFLNRKYGDEIPELNCGDTIIMKDFVITQEKEAPEELGEAQKQQPTAQAQNYGTAGVQVGYLGNINGPGCDPDVP